MRLKRPDKNNLTSDLAGGLTVAMVSIPEGMAYALIAGVDPIYGLYAGMLTVIVGSLFASSQLMVITLTNAVALIVADNLGFLGDDIARGIASLTLLVGIIQLMVGVLKLGKLIRFVSNEVMTGFIAAVATVIVLGQLDELTGYQSNLSGFSNMSGTIIRGIDVLVHPGLWEPTTASIGILTIVVLLLLKRTRMQRFADFLVIIIITGVVALLSLESVELVRDISHIPSEFPPLVAPDPGLFAGLAPAALAIALVALVESAGIGMAFPNPDKSKTDLSKNLTAHGLANLAGCMLAALPGGCSMSRSAINQDCGARTRWGGVFAGIILIAAVTLAGSAFELIPMTALAGLLIVIGVGIFAREVPKMVEAWNASKAYSVSMIATFVLGIAHSLEVAVFAGVVISLALYVYFAAKDVKLVHLVPLDDGRFEETPVPSVFPSNEVTVIHAKGTLYFAAVQTLEEALPDHSETRHAFVILNLTGITLLDTTSIDFLIKYSQDLEENDIRFMITSVDEGIMEQLRRTGAIEAIGEVNVRPEGSIMGDSISEALDIAKAWLEEDVTPSDDGDGEGR